MADVDDDVVEHILIRLDVNDLISCKSVCKSWYSVITNPRFINLHLNCSYNKDRDEKHSHRRIMLAHESPGRYQDNEHHRFHHLVGSSNDLVCISSFIMFKVLVGNPLTREVRNLRLPPRIGTPLCWGFGYDSSNDDYKVILGTWKGMNIQVLSLKSNTWKIIGDLKYAFICKYGVLSNGALHWIVKDTNMKKLIVSYDLSKEEVTEIPQPDDARYECTSHSYLGVFNECLCIHQGSKDSIWLMREYKVKHSWELLIHDHETNYDIVHYLTTPEDFILPESVFRHDESWFSKYNFRVHINAPVFVQSLVSPYFNLTQKRAGIIFRQLFEQPNAKSLNHSQDARCMDIVGSMNLASSFL